MSRLHALTWAALAANAAMAALLWLMDLRAAAQGTAVALLGCLALALPHREAMPRLPLPVRRLPRDRDAAVPLACLLSVPGYAFNVFNRANPYDEYVHLMSGLLAGWVLAGMLEAGRGRAPGALARAGWGLALGVPLAVGWEAFEWAVGIIGDATDTTWDVVLTGGGTALGAALSRPADPAPEDAPPR